MTSSLIRSYDVIIVLLKSFYCFLGFGWINPSIVKTFRLTYRGKGWERWGGGGGGGFCHNPFYNLNNFLSDVFSYC